MDIQAFLQRSAELHADIAKILSYTSPQDIEEEIQARADFRQDLLVVINKLKDKIVELETLTRKLRQESSQQRVDSEKLTNQKILIYSERKRQNL